MLAANFHHSACSFAFRLPDVLNLRTHDIHLYVSALTMLHSFLATRAKHDDSPPIWRHKTRNSGGKKTVDTLTSCIATTAIVRLVETPELPAGAEESICSFSPDSDQHNKPTNASTCVKLLRKESAKCFVHTHDLPSHIVFLAACLALVAARSSLSHSLA